MTASEQLNLFKSPPSASIEEEALEVKTENPDYLKRQIITYIGNKRQLLPFIEKGINVAKDRIGKEKITFLDLFSGSGVVSRAAKKHSQKIIANDLEGYSKVINECYLTNSESIDWKELSEIHESVVKRIESEWEPGFLTRLYSPENEEEIKKGERVFYTRRNATYLDTARKVIETIPHEYKKLFLAPLLSQASMHANTSGVFKGFYKNKDGIGQYGGSAKNALSRITRDIHIEKPVLSNFSCEHEVTQQDAASLIEDIDEVDIAYLDPPYNQHPYGSNYFMLNLICKYQEPEDISKVSGIPKTWNRSSYNKRKEAQDELFNVIEKCRAKFILISYSSEGFIEHEAFINELNHCGKVSVMDTKYNTFRGSRNLRERNIHLTEYLYLIEKN